MSLPLYKKIQQDIFNKIVTGELRSGDRVSSESEIMQQYYVSSITAKNAINALVDQGLVVRIKGKGSFIADTPFTVAVTQKSAVSIGAVFPAMSTRVEQVYMLHLDEYCRQNGYGLYVRCSQESPETEAEIMRDFIRSGMQGLLLFPAVSEQNNDTARQLLGRLTPMVFLDRYLPDMPISRVTSNNVMGAQQAVQYLHSVAGDDIAFVHFKLCNTTISERHSGYEAACREVGIPLTEASFCMIDDLPLLGKSNKERIEYILTCTLTHLQAHPRLRGLFAANAEIAQIVYYAVQQMGLRPSIDVQICSFDNPFLPGVHFIQQDFRQIVHHGIDLLRLQLEGDTTLHQLQVPTQLVLVELSPTHAEGLHNLVMGIRP